MSVDAVSGRRGAVVRRAVLAATLDELGEGGYASLGIERVAARAGVHKTTVYRRWPDRESLVTDALLELAADDFAIPDTGDVDRDLRAFARALVEWLHGPVGRPLVAMLGSDAARLPAAVDARQRFFATRAAALGERMRSAVDGGQLPPAIDPSALLSTIVAPLYLRLLVTGAPVTAADGVRAVDVALLAAREGLLG
jgi:AcrR family transcriptional regulator